MEDGWTAICFAAPVVRTFRDGASRDGASGPSPVDHLGPDLCGPDPNLDEVLRRARRLDRTTWLCDVLLDQRVASGIGNVYKSEVLWACRCHPATALGAIDADALSDLFATAHRLLRANLTTDRRVTHVGVPGGLAVYRRRGRPCPRCGCPIEVRSVGELPRSTYWCPRCQPAPAPPT